MYPTLSYSCNCIVVTAFDISQHHHLLSDKSYYDARRTESTLVIPLTIEQFMRSTKRRISQWKYRELTFNSQEKEHREYLIYTNDIQMRVQSINHALYADGFRTLARSKEGIEEIGRHHCRSFRKHVRRFRDLYDSYREQERINTTLHRVIIKPASLISSFVKSNCEIMPDDSLYDSDDEEDSGSLFGVRLFRTLRPVCVCKHCDDCSMWLGFYSLPVCLSFHRSLL